MIGRRRATLAAAIAGAIALGAAALALGSRSPAPPPDRPSAERPVLLLLTALPLVFPERFGLEGGGSATLARLERRYRVVPIALADARSLGAHSLLLAVQPRAQTAEALVELDRWVRAGGRVVLLADPLLEWPTDLPLGDRLRPPLSYADTGLLGHWGLRLDAPDERGAAARTVGGRAIATVSPGALVGKCPNDGGGLVARCRVGRGAATVVADADLLDPRQVGDASAPNLDFLVAELARLESR